MKPVGKIPEAHASFYSFIFKCWESETNSYTFNLTEVFWRISSNQIKYNICFIWLDML